MSRFVARTKTQVMKGRDNAYRGSSFGDVTLKCGHQVSGEPATSSPDRWWCPECKAFQAARRRAA